MNKFEKLYEEFHDAFSGPFKGDKYVEIFKNPTSKEIQETRRASEFNGLRGLIDKETKDIYIFPEQVLHYRALPYVPNGTYCHISYYYSKNEQDFVIYVSYLPRDDTEITSRLQKTFPDTKIF